jgi:hypothetical protein
LQPKRQRSVGSFVHIYDISRTPRPSFRSLLSHFVLYSFLDISQHGNLLSTHAVTPLVEEVNDMLPDSLSESSRPSISILLQRSLEPVQHLRDSMTNYPSSPSIRFVMLLIRTSGNTPLNARLPRKQNRTHQAKFNLLKDS